MVVLKGYAIHPPPPPTNFSNGIALMHCEEILYIKYYWCAGNIIQCFHEKTCGEVSIDDCQR